MKKALNTLGLDSTEPITIKGVQIAPRDLVAPTCPTGRWSWSPAATDLPWDGRER